MNQAAEGTTYPDVAFTVDPARVAAFRDLFGQRVGVPPTFVTAAEFAVLPRIIDDPELGLDFSRVVHGSQGYVFERPLREGETLTIRARLGSIRVKGGNGFLTIVVDMLDAQGLPVCTARSTMIERAPEA
jgi:N-terminal half of MaoC dehydratase